MIEYLESTEGLSINESIKRYSIKYCILASGFTRLFARKRRTGFQVSAAHNTLARRREWWLVATGGPPPLSTPLFPLDTSAQRTIKAEAPQEGKLGRRLCILEMKTRAHAICLWMVHHFFHSFASAESAVNAGDHELVTPTVRVVSEKL